MKIQSVSQLSALSFNDLITGDKLSAVIEVSKMNNDGKYDSFRLDFRDFIAQISSLIDGAIQDLSSKINTGYVQLSGDQTISGEKTFIGTLKATNVAELSAKHALWS